MSYRGDSKLLTAKPSSQAGNTALWSSLVGAKFGKRASISEAKAFYSRMVLIDFIP